ncbi:hypothetical protein D3C81_2254040 [compost metagenome]
MWAFSMPRIERTISSCTSNGSEVEMPLGYSSWVLRPSGSMNTWWLSLSAKRWILSSIDGQ